jgi:uncharacterized membrane protein
MFPYRSACFVGRGITATAARDRTALKHHDNFPKISTLLKLLWRGLRSSASAVFCYLVQIEHWLMNNGCCLTPL